ncbi:hypothetical protein B566_EDAN010194 [Ephemera danica]|nr:hypothetical protein B566_EDAN010194 [Ephemera danica]
MRCGMHHSRHHLNSSLHLLLFTAGAYCLWFSDIARAVTRSSSEPPARTCWNDGGGNGLCFSNVGVLTCAGSLPPESAGIPQHSLVICDWIDEVFDPRDLRTQPHLTGLRNLSIHAAGNDTDTDRQFSSVFPAGLILESLNISRLGLVNLGPAGLLDSLSATLRSLDASHNHLTTLAPVTFLPLTVLDIALLAGNPWTCGVELTWLVDTPLTPRLADLQEWTCGPEKYKDKPLLPVLQMIKLLRSQCPSRSPYNCTCELSNVVGSAGGAGPANSVIPAEDEEQHGELISVIVVNCSARGLYRLPPYLPANTTTLLLSKNMISDVRPLANNRHYKRVQDVFLDHNQVRSIAALEGSEWLSSFRVLSLRGNQLSQLPTYALDHAFQKNRKLAQLYLGNNQWSCDCMFTPGFQDLIAKYESVIRDAADIRCAKRNDDENSQQPIRELSRSLLCQEPRGGSLTGLDVLNVALALLIVLVLGKLAYDYWAFKTSGRLPWLVAKMP